MPSSQYPPNTTAIETSGSQHKICIITCMSIEETAESASKTATTKLRRRTVLILCFLHLQYTSLSPTSSRSKVLWVAGTQVVKLKLVQSHSHLCS
ncbi:hypothetical protein L3X38_031280 [Prunus dulcis]|uniref:Uncharacterized protein n=1 Tax=Prunus dulcis TaxID=3755 RepID=A0AAD4YVG7_PRUDU|nr:hypothetical protein L3X38_031280 [Prunus dulcis]